VSADGAGNRLLAEVQESWRSGRFLCGAAAGALFGMLMAEFDITDLIHWNYAISDVVILAAFSALLSTYRRFLRYLCVVDLVLLGVLTFISFSPISSELSHDWIRADALPSDGLDAIVVLSSSVTSGGTLSVAGSDRLLAGLELLRGGAAPRIVTTRVAGSGPAPSSDADQRRLIALAGAVDRWILVGDTVRSTRDEALAVDRRLRELGARRIAVVTSPLHTRRACAAFERDAMRVTCWPASERGMQTRWPASGPDRIAAFNAYVYERIGWWVYSRRGWVKDG
jgi:uncharacterized SAM-binding protein YcdF (DUF218 family)